jgi:parallel beta-helix repeat protein
MQKRKLHVAYGSGVTLMILLLGGLSSTASAQTASPAPAISGEKYSVMQRLPTPEPPVLSPSAALHALLLSDKVAQKFSEIQTRLKTTPTLTPANANDTGRRILVLPGRQAVYSIAEVMAAVPSAFARLPDGVLLLNSLVVGRGAELVIDSPTVPRLLLSSGSDGHVLLAAQFGSLTLLGHPGQPMTVTSFNPTTEMFDDNLTDGRAYIVSQGGSIQMEHVTASRLGFPSEGRSSGVAWIDSTGGAKYSTFSHNYFGAYSSGAIGLRVLGSTFSDNDVYGFDPHTLTAGTVVTNSKAMRNGSHGFIVSDGCDDNVFQDSESFLNGGAGFFVDDGRSGDRLSRPSSRNTLVRVAAYDNRKTGIVVEGGKANRVINSTSTNNTFGIWVRGSATDTVIKGNRVTASQWTGIRISEEAAASQVTSNFVSRATNGIDISGKAGSSVVGNVISNASSAAIRLKGDQTQTVIRDVIINGTGTFAIDSSESTFLIEDALAVDTTNWSTTFQKPLTRSMPGFQTAVIAVWLAILLPPIVIGIPMRLAAQRRRRHVPLD